MYNRVIAERDKNYLNSLNTFIINSKNEVACSLLGEDDKDYTLVSRELCDYCIFNHKLDGCGGQSYIAEIADLDISKEKRYQKYEQQIIDLKIIKTKLDMKRQRVFENHYKENRNHNVINIQDLLKKEVRNDK